MGGFIFILYQISLYVYICISDLLLVKFSASIAIPQCIFAIFSKLILIFVKFYDSCWYLVVVSTLASKICYQNCLGSSLLFPFPYTLLNLLVISNTWHYFDWNWILSVDQMIVHIFTIFCLWIHKYINIYVCFYINVFIMFH